MSKTSVGPDLFRQLAAEAIGTMLLVAGIVGSGIMAQHLTDDVALELLCNALATGALLAVLILLFAPISGAHFNPALTMAMATVGEVAASRAMLYGSAQVIGGVGGTVLAHAMFAMPLLSVGITAHSGTGQWVGESVATFGLLLTVFGSRKSGVPVLAFAVGSYIVAAYWFTSSTSFANPAVTLARALTPTFAGIRPVDALMFAIVQLTVAPVAAVAARWLLART